MPVQELGIGFQHLGRSRTRPGLALEQRARTRRISLSFQIPRPQTDVVRLQNQSK